jgi:hypothetical protein
MPKRCTSELLLEGTSTWLPGGTAMISWALFALIGKPSSGT